MTVPEVIVLRYIKRKDTRQGDEKNVFVGPGICFCYGFRHPLVIREDSLFPEMHFK